MFSSTPIYIVRALLCLSRCYDVIGIKSIAIAL